MKAIILFLVLSVLCSCPGVSPDLSANENIRRIGEQSGSGVTGRKSTFQQAMSSGNFSKAANSAVEHCDGCDEKAALTLDEGKQAYRAGLKGGLCGTKKFENKEVLYIGDSHSYLYSKDGSRMGNQVYKQLEACGADGVEYHGVCGSRPSSWMPGKTPASKCGVSKITDSGFSTANSGKTKNIEQLQGQKDPDVVIINLGDNMFSWKIKNGKRYSQINSANVIREVAALVANIDKSKECIWIGPVYHTPSKSLAKSNAHVDQMYAAIKQGLKGRCDLVDSRDTFSKTSPNDGLHLTNKESKIWGDALASKLSKL